MSDCDSKCYFIPLGAFQRGLKVSLLSVPDAVRQEASVLMPLL